MARSPFPTGEGFGRNVSDGGGPINVGAPAAGFTGALADTAQRVGRQVRQMAERAWVREGEADAARVIAAGELTGNKPALRSGLGIDDQAYNTVVRESLFAQRQAAYLEEADKVDIANPDSEIRWSEGNAAMAAAFTPTGDAQLDARFANWRTLQDAQRLGHVREGQERMRIATGRGAYVEAASVGRTSLGQAIANAGFDDQGARLVGVALAQHAEGLARFGPREAFTIGGIEFAADETRAGIVSPELLAETFDVSRREAQMNWISMAAERAPDAAAKRAFVGQVQERWAAGDPAFTGLDAADFDRLTGRLEAGAARAEADEAAAVRAAEDRARQLLKAGEYGDDVDMEELRALALQSGDVGLMAEVEFAATHGFEVTPASLRAAEAGGAGGIAGAGFAGWNDFLLDQLEGPGLVGNDNGRGRAQWGITEASHPEAWRDGRIDRAEAAAIYRREYWDPIGGDNLPPELAIAAASAAVLGGVGTARELLRQSGGDADRFLQLEEARLRGLAARDAAKYGDDLPGWLNRLGKVRGQIGRIRAQRRAAEGYASDPMGYARGTSTRAPLATIAEMNPNDLFDGDEQAARAFLRSRRATAQELSRRDGVPLAIFASEELRTVKDRIERDPGAIVTLVRLAGSEYGGDGARDLLTELSRGGVTGADLRLGYLSQDPGAANIVQMVLSGRQLRADGAKAPTFERDQGLDDAMRSLGPALETQPQAWAAVRSLAEDMAIGDMARGRLGSAASYVNSALGASNTGGERYGGATNVNGRVTIAPTWLRADSVDEALEVAASIWVENDRGPLYSNGQPIPARALSRMQLRAMPNGNYRLINPDTGRPLAARSGSAFEFDIEAESFRDALRRRRPSLVRGVR